MNLTAHFTLEELTASETASVRGIDNTLPAEVITALKRTAELLEDVRRVLGGNPTVAGADIDEGFRIGRYGVGDYGVVNRPGFAGGRLV
jgi:hypothetical protein